MKVRVCILTLLIIYYNKFFSLKIELFKSICQYTHDFLTECLEYTYIYIKYNTPREHHYVYICKYLSKLY